MTSAICIIRRLHPLRSRGPILALRGWRKGLFFVLRSLAAASAALAPRSARGAGIDALPPRLEQYEWKRFSQNGEDGILRELFLRLGQGSKTFVEFGVEDGSECNAALFAVDYGWQGLFIEGSASHYQRLAERYHAFPSVRTCHAMVTAENIARLLHDNGIEPGFDLLSIDIDGNDYYV